jgi:hypothetical protein
LDTRGLIDQKNLPSRNVGDEKVSVRRDYDSPGALEEIGLGDDRLSARAWVDLNQGAGWARRIIRDDEVTAGERRWNSAALQRLDHEPPPIAKR